MTELERSNMIRENMGLVYLLTRSFYSRKDHKDIVGQATIGLIRAVDKFNPENGAKFSYYAKFHITERIDYFLKENKSICHSFYTVRKHTQMMKIIDVYKQKNNLREPDVEYIAEKMGKSVDIVKEWMQIHFLYKEADKHNDDVHSVSSSKEQFNRSKGVDEIVVEKESTGDNIQQIRAGLEQALSTLTEKEALIVKLRFGLIEDKEHTFAEIATIIGASKERVRQIEVGALNKLQDCKLTSLREFLK